MTSATVLPGNANVVHEAVDERQFVRTKIPARVTLSANNSSLECELQDISLGGLGILCDRQLPVGGMFNAAVHMNLNGVDLTIDSKIKVLSQRGREVGAEFVELDPKKRDILRYLMSAYMSGEMADINGLFNVMQRENYIKARKKSVNQERGTAQRLKAAGGTLVWMILGLAAATFVVYKTHQMLFRIPAAQAMVSADSYRLTMPDNGYVKYTLPPEKTEVKTGDPIATVSTQLASTLNTPADVGALANLSQADLQVVLGRSLIETVIASPCDCFLFFPEKRLDAYAYKEQPLVHLIPKNEDLYIKASFPFGTIDDLGNISSVKLSVYGVGERIDGEIVRSAVDEVNRMLVLTIRPESQLPLESYNKPASVELYRGLPFGLSSAVSL